MTDVPLDEIRKELAEHIWETVRDVINAVYGTDDKHAFMGLKVARHVVYRETIPWDLAKRSEQDEGPRYVQLVYADPNDPGTYALEVGGLCDMLDGRDAHQRVLVDTGNGRDQLLPVYAVADDDTRVVLEL